MCRKRRLRRPPVRYRKMNRSRNAAKTGCWLPGRRMETLAQLNRPLWGILLNSAAYVRGDFLLIQSENPTFPSFIKTGSNARDVKEAAFRVTGQKYRLGIYRPAQDAQPSMQTPAEDPLDTLLAKAQALGVNVTE